MGKLERQRCRDLLVIRYLMQEGRCHYCGVEMIAPKFIEGRRPGNEASCDHVVPRSKGGWSTFVNIVASCRSCNNAKGDDLPSIIHVVADGGH